MKYSEVLLELSRPTTNQYTSFAEDLLSFHSWYKHLDRINGNRFVFFLDPEGVPRLNKSAGEHRPYNFKQSSEEYRSAYVHRYGCINYSVLNVWEQPPTYIEFRGERIIVPNEVLQRQSCILFPYCYSASSKYMAMPSLVELLLNGWAKTEEQLLHHENRLFI